MEQPADYDHLLTHAQNLFPGFHIEVIYTEDEIIYIDVSGRRFKFEIGSDDDAYIFDDGIKSFAIPLFYDGTWDFT